MQAYAWQDGAWTQDGDAAIMSWDELLDGLGEDTPAIISGEIDERAAVKLAARQEAGWPLQIAAGTDRLRRAGYLAECAWTRFRGQDLDDPYTLTPIYLHQPGVPHP